MRFNPKARLDRGRVKDTGQGAGGGGRGIPIPGGAAGGGIGGLLIVVLIVVLTQFLGGGGATSDYSTNRLEDAADTGRYDHCKTGEDANRDHDCARVAVENSLTDFWEGELGSDFRAEEQLVTF